MFKSTITFEASSVILRTPLYPLDVHSIDEIIRSKEFRLAVHLASPSLVHQHIDGANLKGKLALIKYAVRAMTRPTPFGGFSSITKLELSDKTTIEFSGDLSYCIQTDGELCSLSHDAVVKADANYFLNPLTYFKGDDIYYIDFEPMDRFTKQYRVNKIKGNDLLAGLLVKCKSITSYVDMINFVSLAAACSEEESINFIRTLIDNKILLPISEYFINSSNISELIQVIENKAVRDQLELFKTTFLKNDDGGATEILQRIEQWENAVTGLEFPLKVDLYRHTAENKLSTEVISQLKKAVYLLLRIKEKEYSLLEDLKVRFERSYGDREVSLLSLLYEENDLTLGATPLNDSNEHSGTKFFSKIKADNPHHSPITLPEKKRLKLLLDTLTENKFSIQLTEEIIANHLETKHSKDLPDSFSVQFRLFTENGVQKIFVERAGGNSAADVLSRFSDLSDTCKKIYEAEKKRHPDKIIAQLIHVPDANSSNIISAKPIADHIIPCPDITFPHDPDKIISPGDLTISLRNGRMVLRSRSLDKEILTRNYSAYDYSISKLTVFHLLSVLQEENKITNLNFNWGRLAITSNFLPRIEQENVVISLATWRILNKDLKFLFSLEKMPDDKIIEEFTRFREQKKIPTQVILTDEGDQELFIDLEDPVSLRLFLESIKGRSLVHLKEFLPFHRSGLIKDGEYVNQLIASFNRTDKENTQTGIAKEKIAINNKFKHISFLPGSAWIYFKIYCREFESDQLLREHIHSTIKMLINEKKIDQWFFVRYEDTKPHLRIRLHVSSTGETSHIMNQFCTTLNSIVNNKIIHEIVLDTYEPESERYGDENMNNSEKLFYLDSENVLHLLASSGGSGKLKFQFALAYINFIFCSFLTGSKVKMQWTRRMSDHLEKEFVLSDKKGFRSYKEKYMELFGRSIRKGMPLDEEALKKYGALAEGINQLYENEEEKKYSLVASYIHMTVNRIFSADQRINEVMLYNILHGFYSSVFHKEKALKNYEFKE